MDQLSNHECYVARATSSRGLAQRAASPVVAAIHEEMASRYDSTAVLTRQNVTRLQAS